MKFKYNCRVVIKGIDEMKGSIIGTATILENDEMRTLYVVELDEGFWNGSRKTVYTSKVLVAEDGLELWSNYYPGGCAG